MTVEEYWKRHEAALRHHAPHSTPYGRERIRAAARDLMLAAYRLGAYRAKNAELYCDRCDATLGVTEHEDDCYTAQEEARLEALGREGG